MPDSMSIETAKEKGILSSEKAKELARAGYEKIKPIVRKGIVIGIDATKRVAGEIKREAIPLAKKALIRAYPRLKTEKIPVKTEIIEKKGKKYKRTTYEIRHVASTLGLGPGMQISPGEFVDTGIISSNLDKPVFVRISIDENEIGISVPDEKAIYIKSDDLSTLIEYLQRIQEIISHGYL